MRVILSSLASAMRKFGLRSPPDGPSYQVIECPDGFFCDRVLALSTSEGFCPVGALAVTRWLDDCSNEVEELQASSPRVGIHLPSHPVNLWRGVADRTMCEVQDTGT
jgi:hypothetical protein